MTDTPLSPLVRSLLDNKFVAILVVKNGQNQARVEHVNSRAEQLFGLSAEQLKEGNLAELLHFDQSDNSLARLVSIAQDVIVRGSVKIEDAEGDSRLIPVDISVASVEGQDSFCVFLTDSKDRESFNFLKRQFYKRITHELRSPLSSIVGALALLKSGKLSKIESIVQIAERNSKRLTLMINSILDVEQFESGRIYLQKRRSNLKALVHDSLSLGRLSFFAEESKVEIEGSCDIEIDADEERLPPGYIRVNQIILSPSNNSSKRSRSRHRTKMVGQTCALP
ncbi:MAG: histidine kinase dimerization/phospho-acceptor domain-containing protein [Cyanobacteriota/Melainabacteria group bacterium]